MNPLRPDFAGRGERDPPVSAADVVYSISLFDVLMPEYVHRVAECKHTSVAKIDRVVTYLLLGLPEDGLGQTDVWKTRATQ